MALLGSRQKVWNESLLKKENQWLLQNFVKSLACVLPPDSLASPFITHPEQGVAAHWKTKRIMTILPLPLFSLSTIVLPYNQILAIWYMAILMHWDKHITYTLIPQHWCLQTGPVRTWLTSLIIETIYYMGCNKYMILYLHCGHST